MKKILIIDEAEVIRKFLQRKLEEFGFETELASNGLEGSMKIRSWDPDLIVMDYYLSRLSATELLQKKFDDPNTKNIPVLFASGKISREVIIELSKFGIKKFITKPIKIDSLVKAVSELLNVNLELDNTPCIIDANYNEEILFIEVARGLNSEKIELLRYRLQELIKLYQIGIPKILLMLTGLEIGEADSIKLRTLIDGVITSTNVRQRNFKVLTQSDAVKEFLSGRPALAEIEVCPSLTEAIDGLMGSRAGGYRDEAGTVHDDFLRVGQGSGDLDESFNLRFQSEQAAAEVNFHDMGAQFRIAVVDDDMVIRELVKTAFSKTQIHIDTFENGKLFAAAADTGEYDLVFLDLLMPEMNGFQVLDYLNTHNIKLTIIVLSAVNKRETVVQALQKGVKSYMVKPIDPDIAYKKALEIFRLNF